MNKLKDSLRPLGIKRGDIILAALLLTVSAVMGLFLLLSQPEPEFVSVKIDGKEITRLPLDADCRYPVGDGNIIEISDGSVRMVYADCPDRICVKTGSISRSGQSIVCAPHRVTVTIVGGNSEKSYDIRTN